MPCRIETHANELTVTGEFGLRDLRRATAAIYDLTNKQGYSRVKVDFSRCTQSAPGSMLGLASELRAARLMGHTFDFVLPVDTQLARVFIGANWAHLVDPARYRKSTYKGYTHVPATPFADEIEQPRAVNRMIDAVLCSIQGIDRSDLTAIEWSMNEVTDNVLLHAESPVGGLAQLNNFNRRKRVEFCVADTGKGIPNTLRPRFPDAKGDAQLLEQAIKEGVTRDPTVGQGNGLFGTFQAARSSKGYLHILSGYATLSYEENQLHLVGEKSPYTGTLIVVSMDYSNPLALADALKFGDSAFFPAGYIDLRFEDRTNEELVFHMHEEAPSCGSRAVGAPLRRKLKNLISMHHGKRFVVDMSQIPLVSSSFADEVFGKLFKELGPIQFTQAIEFRHVSATVRGLIDRAILQRSRAQD